MDTVWEAKEERERALEARKKSGRQRSCRAAASWNMYPAEKKKKGENKSTCCLLQCFYLGAAGSWELGVGVGLQ
jgi:hypothetical protein